MSSRRDLYSGSVLLGFGLFMIGQASRLSLWRDGEPRQGFFPMAIGLLIVALSALLCAQSLRQKRPSLQTDALASSNPSRVLAYVCMMVGFVIALERVGFVIASVGFLLVMLAAVERQPRLASVLIGAGVTTAAYLLFVVLLKVPLPR